MNIPLVKAGIFAWFIIAAIASVAVADDITDLGPKAVGSENKPFGHLFFTTDAYRKEALRLVISEANHAAKELKLPEVIPISESNLIKSFINPYGYARARGAIGNITTEPFAYYVSKGSKLSYIEGTHQTEDCQRYMASYTWPISKIDTNQAYRLAMQWLAAFSADVKSLAQNCQVRISSDDAYVKCPAGKFVPVYFVNWSKGFGIGSSVASVRVFAPKNTLLQLRVEDPTYILREPIVFTNLDVLLSTNATDHTTR